LFFVRSADSAEITPRAGTTRRGRRQEAQLDSAIDDFKCLEADAPVGVVDGNVVIGKASGGSAVEQSAESDFTAERLLDGQAVEHRLQNGPSANHRPVGRSVLSGFVIGDPQHSAAAFSLDEIN
jgi:hypothetical protein